MKISSSALCILVVVGCSSSSLSSAAPTSTTHDVSAPATTLRGARQTTDIDAASPAASGVRKLKKEGKEEYVEEEAAAEPEEFVEEEPEDESEAEAEEVEDCKGPACDSEDDEEEAAAEPEEAIDEEPDAEEPEEVEDCRGPKCDEEDHPEEEDSNEEEDESAPDADEVEETNADATAEQPEEIAEVVQEQEEEEEEEEDTTDNTTTEEMIGEQDGAETPIVENDEPEYIALEEESEGEPEPIVQGEEEEAEAPAYDEDNNKAIIVDENSFINESSPPADNKDEDNNKNNANNNGNVDNFPGPSDTAIGLMGENNNSIEVSSSNNRDSLEPVGKIVISLALSGVFAACLAFFLVRRQRRKTSGGISGSTPYSPSKDNSFFVDRDNSMEDTVDGSGGDASPLKLKDGEKADSSRALVMVGSGETTALDLVENGSEEDYQCTDIEASAPTTLEPYGPEDPPAAEEQPPTKFSLADFGATSMLCCANLDLPRQLVSSNSTSSAIVSHTGNGQEIVAAAAPQMTSDGRITVYEEGNNAPEDETNTARAIVRKFQVENTVML